MPRLAAAVLAVSGASAAALALSAPAAASAAPVSASAAPADAGPSVAGTVAAVPAGTQDFTFSSLDVDYALDRAQDGTSELTVVETFVADFPATDQNHGMQRVLPTEYLGAPLHPTLVSVTDENGVDRPVETGNDDGDFVITSADDDFVHGEQSYVFTYTMVNVTRHFSDTGADEFYWDLVDSGFAQPFGTMSATLTVAPDLADAITGDGYCYVSDGDCSLMREDGDDGSAVFSSTRPSVPAYGAMTVAIGFESSTFAAFDPAVTASVPGVLAVGGGVATLGMVVVAGVVRGRRLKDAPGRPTVIAEYEPPRGWEIGECSSLIGGRNLVAAKLLDLAVGGAIALQEGETRGFLGGTRSAYSARLVDDSRVDPAGRVLLSGMFGYMLHDSDVYAFGKSDQSFARSASNYSRMCTEESKRHGLWQRVPAGARVWPVVGVVLLAAATVVLAIVAMAGYVSPVVPVIAIAVAVLSVVTVVILVSRTPKTPLGAELRDHLEGLRLFIGWAEADRIRMLQSVTGAERMPVDTSDPVRMLRLYESLLPYAVLFGMEKSWATVLAPYVASAGPDGVGWYVSPHGFDPAHFAAGVQSVVSSTASSSSSTSGGSSGGGSAGGGGGGGGGGGV